MKRDKHFPSLNPGNIQTDLKNKQIAIIGGTGGIGQALSRYMSSQGAKVLVVGQTFRDQDMVGITFVKADLSLMSEAKRVAQLLPAETLDMLIFTTGIFAAPRRQETTEGIEKDMAISYLSRYVILHEIAERLGTQSTHKPRVFIMGYPGTGKIGSYEDLNAEKSYKAMDVHMNTVAGNEMLVLDSARRYDNFTVFGLNPGLIKTNIRTNFIGGNKLLFSLLEGLIGLLSPTAAQYASQITPLLLATELDRHTGTLFDHKGHALLPSTGITEPIHMAQFFEQSQALIEKTIAR